MLHFNVAFNHDGNTEGTHKAIRSVKLDLITQPKRKSAKHSWYDYEETTGLLATVAFTILLLL